MRDTVNTVIPQDQQALREDLGQARERLDALTQELRGVDGELEALSKEQRHHELLSSACDALDQLSELGGTGLFWGEHVDASLRDSLMARAAKGHTGWRPIHPSQRIVSEERGRSPNLTDYAPGDGKVIYCKALV